MGSAPSPPCPSRTAMITLTLEETLLEETLQVKIQAFNTMYRYPEVIWLVRKISAKATNDALE